MKKKVLLVTLLVVAIVASCFAFTACNKDGDKDKTYEIAVVTDVGQLMDGGFNQGTYEGAKAYAEAHGKTYKYYQPANGGNATDNDRIAAMRQAIKNGAKIIVAPGFLQATAMATVAAESPEVKFIFIDGWALTDAKGNILNNVTAVVYKEEESGFMAGYAAVKEGFTNLGGIFGGGGSNPACNRFASGYVQGISAAATELNKTDVKVTVSFKNAANFEANPTLQTQIAGWYETGTQVVFACGGSIFQNVKSAAEATKDGKIIGVDVDQAALSDRVITSAVKGLKVSVEKILGEYYNNEWDTKLAGKASNLGATDDATGLPTATWRLKNFTVEEYTALFNSIKNGTVTVNSDILSDCNVEKFWQELVKDSTVTVTLDK